MKLSHGGGKYLSREREMSCSGVVLATSMFLKLQLQGNMSRDSTLELPCLGI
jgi:hypothetical protein